ncbi:hypothetical protein ACG98H_10795 [Corynebacterium sp. L4756]|uniref:hypothetical protein n=1 Tax=unclassified Corynebacterium TaxID=2624378 RepID=UPI00374C98CE
MAGKGSGRRAIGVVLGIVLMIIAVGAIFIGRDDANRGRIDALVDSIKPVENVVDVSILVGSEKQDFFHDPRVQEAFEAEGFNVTVSTMGSLEMNERAREGTLSEHDFYFPAGHGNPDLRDYVGDASQSVLFLGSNIALVARRDIAEDLVAQGEFHEEDGQFFVESVALFNLLTSQRRWRDVTDTFQSPRTIGAITSDPSRSSSSSNFAYIMASAAMQGQLNTVDQHNDGASQVLPIFQSQGLTEGSSGDAFQQFIASNGQDLPLAVAYDSQYVAMANRNPSITRGFVLVSIKPTLQVLHDLIAHEDAPRADEFYEALAHDPRILNLMMEHGLYPTGQGLESRFVKVNSGLVPEDNQYIDPYPTPDQLNLFSAQFESMK